MAAFSASESGTRNNDGDRQASRVSVDVPLEARLETPFDGILDTPANIAIVATQRLHSGPYTILRNVYCEVEDGRLVIRGRVNSFYLKQVAQSVVARVPGVAAIDNQIEVAIPR